MVNLLLILDKEIVNQLTPKLGLDYFDHIKYKQISSIQQSYYISDFNGLMEITNLIYLFADHAEEYVLASDGKNLYYQTGNRPFKVNDCFKHIVSIKTRFDYSVLTARNDEKSIYIMSHESTEAFKIPSKNIIDVVYIYLYDSCKIKEEYGIRIIMALTKDGNLNILKNVGKVISEYEQEQINLNLKVEKIISHEYNNVDYNDRTLRQYDRNINTIILKSNEEIFSLNLNFGDTIEVELKELYINYSYYNLTKYVHERSKVLDTDQYIRFRKYSAIFLVNSNGKNLIIIEFSRRGRETIKRDIFELTDQKVTKLVAGDNICYFYLDEASGNNIYAFMSIENNEILKLGSPSDIKVLHNSHSSGNQLIKLNDVVHVNESLISLYP